MDICDKCPHQAGLLLYVGPRGEGNFYLCTCCFKEQWRTLDDNPDLFAVVPLTRRMFTAAYGSLVADIETAFSGVTARIIRRSQP
jgi:hypothetical protein